MKKMKWALVLAGAAAALSFAAAPMVQAEGSDYRTITVSGNGTLKVAADRATVNVGFESTAATAQQASADNANTMSAVRNAVIAAGLTDGQVQTSDYNLWPQYRTDNKGKTSLEGYRASNTMTLTIDNVRTTGRIMDAAVKAGANRINSVSFSVKDQNQYKEEVLRKAVADARGKADAIAAALGKQVVNVVSVNENGARFVMFRTNQLMAAKALDSGAATPVEPQDVEVSADVTIVFEIQ